MHLKERGEMKIDISGLAHQHDPFTRWTIHDKEMFTNYTCN
jgi:hypothetical protein